MCWGEEDHGIWQCMVGGQSENLLFVGQRHWSCSLIHCRSEVKEEVKVEEERWLPGPKEKGVVRIFLCKILIS